MKALIAVAMVAALAEGECDPAIQHGRAEAAYTAYLNRMYPPSAGFVVINAECTNSDSDLDGYVSCGATVRDAEGGHGALVRDSSECGYSDNTSRPQGCRLPKATVRSGG